MRIAQAGGVFAKKIKGKFVLLEKDKQHVRELNPLATRLWELSQKPTTINQLVKTITQEYQVKTKTAQKDINAWVKNFIKLGLLQKVN